MGSARRARFAILIWLTIAAAASGCGLLPGSTNPSLAPSRPVDAVRSLAPLGTRDPDAAPTLDPRSDLPVVALADLPPEAAATVALIDAGGPFPYAQDGSVFQNREGLLPPRRTGYYREFTVPTPGSDDRGARRIVAGADGEMYWTADHYDSFAWIDR